MRAVYKPLIVLCAVGATLAVSRAGPVAAQNIVILGEDASECDIAGALGIAKPGCPPVGAGVVSLGRETRGLRIGAIDQMMDPPPAPPSDGARPVQIASASPHEYTAGFRVNFWFDSARLTGHAQHLLDRIGVVMTTPGAEATAFRISGHTDGVGPAAHNQWLSEARAEAVKGYIVSHYHIEPSRLQAVGKGASELLDPAAPAAPENRRVDITSLVN